MVKPGNCPWQLQLSSYHSYFVENGSEYFTVWLNHSLQLESCSVSQPELCVVLFYNVAYLHSLGMVTVATPEAYLTFSDLDLDPSTFKNYGSSVDSTTASTKVWWNSVHWFIRYRSNRIHAQTDARTYRRWKHKNTLVLFLWKQLSDKKWRRRAKAAAKAEKKRWKWIKSDRYRLARRWSPAVCYDCWSHPVGKSRPVCLPSSRLRPQAGAVANAGWPASQIASFGLWCAESTNSISAPTPPAAATAAAELDPIGNWW